jgi:hypothetical protein
MKRTDWLAQLLQQIEAANKRTFAWGDHDCCLFAARCVDAMRGSEFAEELRLAYSDQASALAFVSSEGGLEAALTARFGESFPWWKAHRGDLCLVNTPDGIGSVGICMGPTIACVSETKGLTYVKIDKAARCWET